MKIRGNKIEMKRWGEIGRVYGEEFNYLVFTSAEPYHQYDAVWFNLKRSNKTSKRKGIDSYSLLSHTFNLGIMKQIENIIKNYLDEIKPEFLAIAAEEDRWKKRIRVYLDRLDHMGYTVVDKWERDWKEDTVFILKRQV